MRNSYQLEDAAIAVGITNWKNVSVALFGCNFSIVRNLAIIAFTRLFFHTHRG